MNFLPNLFSKEEQHVTDINLPNPVSTIHTHMDKLQSFDEINAWRGICLFSKIFYMYLYHKYNQNCLAISKKSVALMFDDNKDFTISNEEIIANIVNCILRGVDILLIPIRLSQPSHANLMIYRKINNTIEIFEPNGHFNYTDKYDTFISQINSKLHPIHIKLIKTESVCPRRFGLQYLQSRKTEEKEGRGYCLAWCMFFAELVLINPLKTSNELLSEIFLKLDSLPDPRNYLLRVIRGYVNVIKLVVEKQLKIISSDHVKSYDDVIRMFYSTDEDHKKMVTEEVTYPMNKLFESNVDMLDPTTDKYIFLKKMLYYKPQFYEQFIEFLNNDDNSPPYNRQWDVPQKYKEDVLKKYKKSSQPILTEERLPDVLQHIQNNPPVLSYDQKYKSLKAQPAQNAGCFTRKRKKKKTKKNKKNKRNNTRK
jgi:hypothetical protein